MKTMFRLSLTLILIFSSASAYSQTMSISTGIGNTHYFDIIKEDHLSSDYGFGKTYFIKVDFSNDQSPSLFSDIAFKLEKQSGFVNYYSSAMWCGLGLPSGLIFTDEKIEKYTISAIAYPLQWNISNKIKLRSGIALSKTFQFDAINILDMGNDIDEVIFEPQIKTRSFSADAAFELRFGSIVQKNGISLRPVYNVFISLTPEFLGPYNTLSLRHSLGLAMVWGLKEK